MSALIEKADQTITEPFTLTSAKQHLRIDHDEDDILIAALISAARHHAEGFIHKSLAVKQYELYFDRFQSNFELPVPPLVSVQSIKYIDVNGTEQTLPNSKYIVDTKSLNGRVVLASGESWPTTGDVINAVVISFTAGYSKCPEDIVAGMKLLLGDLYENREDTIVGTGVSQVPNGYRQLLWPHRIDFFG